MKSILYILLAFMLISCAHVKQVEVLGNTFQEDHIGAVESYKKNRLNFNDFPLYNLSFSCQSFLLAGKFEDVEKCIEPLKNGSKIDLSDTSSKMVYHTYYTNIYLTMNMTSEAHNHFKKASEYSDKLPANNKTLKVFPVAYYRTLHEVNYLFTGVKFYTAIGNKEEALRFFKLLMKYPKNKLSANDIKEYTLKTAFSAVLVNDYSLAKKLIYTPINTKSKARVFEAIFTLGFSEIIRTSSMTKRMYTDVYSIEKLYLLAKVNYELGTYDDAKIFYDGIISGDLIKKHVLSYFDNKKITERRPTLSIAIFTERALIAFKEKDYGLAEDYYLKAIKLIEKHRSSTNNEVLRIGFIGDKQQAYNDLIRLYIETERADKAFEIVERSKSRTLVDILAQKKTFIVKNDSKKLLMEISALDTQLANSFVTHHDKQSIERNLDNYRIQLKDSNEQLASLISVTPLKFDEIQRFMPADETLIEYYNQGSQYYAFVLTKQNIAVYPLPQFNPNLIKDFRKAIKAYPEKVRALKKISNKVPRAETYDSTIETQLYRVLIEPIARHINSKKLIIIPHGSLHYLPFNALSKNNDYLMDKYLLRILPSASVLKYLNTEIRSFDKNILIFGNPSLKDASLSLPGAEKESIIIKDTNDDVTLFIRDDATETRAKRFSSLYKTIHFASHATFNSDKPLSSGLLLSQDDQNDGYLTVSELYDLNIPADLVTLSACETGLGKVSNGDDVVGFTRGFLYAGVSSILSSLWKVDDQATSILMQRFYAYRSAGDSKTVALNKAQKYVKDNVNSHPYYWAAFQLTGNAN